MAAGHGLGSLKSVTESGIRLHNIAWEAILTHRKSYTSQYFNKKRAYHHQAYDKMSPFNLIHPLLQQVTEKGSRSTVLKPLVWVIAILVSASISSFSFKAPLWLGIMFSFFCGLAMLLYLCSYLYLMVTDKDALRSETYSIQKLAIERGLRGDDLHGVITLDTEQDVQRLEMTPSSTSEAEE